MIRVLLADDEALIRAGLRSILETDDDITVVAEASNSREAITLTEAHRPDVVLLDVRMPGPTPAGDGLDTIEHLRRHQPGIAVTVLTTFDEDEYVARAVRAGAAGFLLKAADPRELLAAIRATADGDGYLSPRITARVLRRLQSRPDEDSDSERVRARKLVATLTDRERDVLALLARGLSNHEIGRELFVSEGTVKAHLSALLARLGVDNRVRAAVIWTAASQQ
ncbi:response regulator transcription factor [Pseudonocardia sp. ICBG1293]|uniref:response regulator n=1 Tax=Pseudonocardia sp. ICBG1293 TaxID=2844382 RepID=UPI001CCB31FF|nr:response regulator transcription factor [Pseudonocardia sp. ICBG1293]